MAIFGACLKDTFEASTAGTTEFYAVEIDESQIHKVHNCDAAGAAVIGIAQDTSVNGHPVDVIVFGLARAKLGGTVSAGDALTTNNVGKLVVATTGDYIIARANQPGVANDAIMVFVNHEGIEGTGGGGGGGSTDVVDIDFIAASDLSANQYQFVKINGVEVDAPYPSALGRCVGVLQNTPDINETATVRVLGRSSIKLAMTVGNGALVGNSGSLDPEDDAAHSGRAYLLDSESGGFCMGVIITGGDVDEVGEMMVQVEGFTVG